MTTTTLKVQLYDEIRRVTVDTSRIKLDDLEIKVRGMFPQLSDFVLQYKDEDGTNNDIVTDSDLSIAFTKALAKYPPLLRISVDAGRSKVLANPTNPVDEPLLETIDEIITAVSDDSEDGSSSSTVSSSSCSNCNNKIGWVYYKCINCIDTLLCESCESIGVHDCTHLLVKLRIPFESLPLKQQLVFTEYVLNQDHKLAANQKKKELRRMIRAKEKIQSKAERVKARKERIRRRFEVKKKLDEKAKRTTKKVVPKAKKTKKVVKKEGIPATVSEPVPQPLVEEIVNDLFVSPEAIPVPVPETVPEIVSAPVLFDSALFGVEEIEEPVIAEQTQKIEELVDIPQIEEVDDLVICETKEIDLPVEEKKDDQAWNFYDVVSGSIKDIGDTLSSTVSGVTTALTPSPEDHRIQGIAFRQKLDALESMGFTDRNRNILLLVKNLASLETTVDELVSSESS